MGKTSLANTFAEFLKNPTKAPKPKLTEDGSLRYTKVMELTEGLSINHKKSLSVQLNDLAPKSPRVKLVKLTSSVVNEGKRKRFKKKLTSWLTPLLMGAPDDTSEDVQVKLVDIGGHTAIALVLKPTIAWQCFYVSFSPLLIFFVERET